MENLQDNEKELALSNSQSESYYLGKEKKENTKIDNFDYFSLEEYQIESGFVNCYLDRLTIVGNLPDEYIGSEEPFPLLPWRTLSRFTGGGWRAEIFPERKQKLYVEFDPDNAKVMRKRNFRVECNPNLLALDQLQVLFNIIVPSLSNVSISRVDLAFDYERKLNDFVFEKSLSGGKFWDKSGNTQTIYFGSPSSDFRCRLYDKKAERLAKGSEEDKTEYQAYETLWRLEYELTGSGYVEGQIRKNFEVIQENKITKRDYDIKLAVPLNPLEKLMLKNYDTERDMFNELNKNTKSKYKKLASKISDVNLTDNLRTVIKQMQICSDTPMKINVTDFCNAILNRKHPLPEIYREIKEKKVKMFDEKSEKVKIAQFRKMYFIIDRRPTDSKLKGFAELLSNMKKKYGNLLTSDEAEESESISLKEVREARNIFENIKVEMERLINE